MGRALIVLDTHIWYWWVQGQSRLRAAHAAAIREAEPSGLLVCAISLVEVARAATTGRLKLPGPTDEWLEAALSYPGVTSVPLTPRLVTEAYSLPGDIHKDPADRLIVATARVYDCPLLTEDDLIRRYPHVKLL